MATMLVFFISGLLLDVLLYWTVPLPRRLRQMVAALGVVVTAFASGALLVWWPNVASCLIAALGLYRAFNNIRLVEGRMHFQHARYATRRTALVLVALQSLVVVGWLAWEKWPLSGVAIWTVAAVGQAAAAAVLLWSARRTLRRTAWTSPAHHYSDQELPTVTVAIPARNETQDLQACLQSVIASDYPKLEILVLDDCSQNKRTPEIIRSFAHDGVRFIKGEEPSETWLPKNQAYRRLAAEASGAYILFCGVDIRFSPDSIRQIAKMLLTSKKQMVSLLPQRHASVTDRFALVQAMRYWWEIVPPRRLFNRPPVLSSCWIIARDALQKSGGFEAVSRSIVPESYFAKRLLASDGYSFRRAGNGLDIQSVKLASDQRATAIRTRYPQLHRKPEAVFVLSLAEVFFLLLPFVLPVAGFWFEIGLAGQLLAASAALMLVYTHALLAQKTRINTPWFAFAALPPMVVADIAMLHYSMWRYEFSTVIWKGRNVCIPVMHVVPHLPPLDDTSK